MTEEASSPHGRCEGCGKMFRVPQAGKTYRCKACGGSVVTETEEPSDDSAIDEEGREERAEPAAPSRRAGHRHVGVPRPIAGRGNAVLALLALGALADAVAVYTGFAQRSLILRVLEGAEVTAEEADANDRLYGTVGWVQSGIFLITAVAWFLWIHRASSNQRPLGARHVKYSPGWAVGGWFVPVLNLWRPYQVTAEIWRHSAVAARTRAGETRVRAPSSTLVGIWWGAWLLDNFLARLATRGLWDASEATDYLDLTHAMLVSDAFAILSAATAFAVVLRITTWQREAGA
jgi:hypothetical protein